MNSENAKTLTKQDKLDKLNIKSHSSLPDEYIDLLYREFVYKKEEEERKKNSIIHVDKTTERYKLLLEYTNNILENMGRNPIDDVTEFQRIDREDIVTEKNKKMAEGMKKRLNKHFDKAKNVYATSKGKNTLPHNLLRGLCKEVGVGYVGIKGTKWRDKTLKSKYMYSINLRTK